MRLVAIVLCLLLLAPMTLAQSLGSAPPYKTAPTPGLHPGTPDGREGGETVATAIDIPDLPFTDTGNTSDNVDDYDVECPFGASLSPDVVYRYVAPADMGISVDLCGSGYDTKTYIFDAEMNVIACNDDYYFDDSCGQYVSYIEGAFLAGGQTYYFVVDGYGGDSGDYVFQVLGIHIPEPCVLECPTGSTSEGEPPLMNGYLDSYNSGCGSEQGDLPFQDLFGDENGDLTFCGVSGWFDQASRDTDWLTVTLGPEGLATWELMAEQDLHGFQLGPLDCADVAILQTILATGCEPQTMTLQGDPGEMLWIWTGPSEFSPPIGFEGHEFRYIATFQGLSSGIVATEGVSFDRLKSLYR